MKAKKTEEEKMLAVDSLQTLVGRLEKKGEKIISYDGAEIITSFNKKKYRYGLYDGIASRTEL